MLNAHKHWTVTHINNLWFSKQWWFKMLFHTPSHECICINLADDALSFLLEAKYLRKIKTYIISDLCHASLQAINMKKRGCDLRCRCQVEDSQLFCMDDQGIPTSIPSKSSCHYLLQVFVLLNRSPEVCCLSPQLTCIHAHTSSKTVLVNEIRLNHALAFHQSLCDGCSPLIHGSQPLQLLPVCTDISNSLLYLTPCWAVDLPEEQALRDEDHPQPIAITSTYIHIYNQSKHIPGRRPSKNISADQLFFFFCRSRLSQPLQQILFVACYSQ